MIAFEELVETHRAVLRLHCYRMLGSSYDSDDMVQETFVRAFRARESLADPAAARPWLYRIATNVCLDELAKRRPRARGPELGPPAAPEPGPAGSRPDDEWIEPCPSEWLESAPRDPGVEYTMKESVALAFVAALQVLTPAQRAVLLLRDVVGLSADETATALGTSTSAANSTLHRARTALEERVGPRGSWSPAPDAPVDHALLERYLRAWESQDLGTIVTLLHEEVTLSMPPFLTWVQGRNIVERFFQHRIGADPKGHVFRALAIGANGGPAVAFYRVGDDGVARFFAIHTVEIRDGKLAVLDHFMTKSAARAFFAAGLLEVIAGT